MSSSSLVRPNTKLGIVLAIVSSIIYGVYPAACRGAYADGANPVFVVFITTFVRTLMLAGFCFITNKRLFEGRENRKIAITGGLWQTLSVVCVVTSLSLIPGPIVLIIMFSSTLFLLFYMAWKREVKLDSVNISTTLIALLGLAFVLDVWHVQPTSNWLGMALAFGAAIATLSRVYVYGTQMRDRPPAVVGAESFIIVCLIMPALLFWKMPVAPDHITGWGWTMASALSLGLGSFGTFYGIAMLGSFKWSLFMKIEPIFTSLFSILFLGEYLKLSQYAGIGLVLGSLIVYQVLSQRLEAKKSELAEAEH